MRLPGINCSVNTSNDMSKVCFFIRLFALLQTFVRMSANVNNGLYNLNAKYTISADVAAFLYSRKVVSRFTVITYSLL